MSDTLDNAHNVNVERAVLGQLLSGNHPEAIDQVLEHGGADLFFHRPHRLIATAAALLAAEGSAVDTATVQGALASMSNGDSAIAGRALAIDHGLHARDSALHAMGQEPFNAISDATSTWSGFPINLRTLAKLHRQRQAIALLREASEHIRSPSATRELDRMLGTLGERMDALLRPGQGVDDMGAAMTAVLERHDQVSGSPPRSPAQWGLGLLDAMLPLDPGRLIVLAGASGFGKTSLGMQVAAATAVRSGSAGVGVISLEMSAAELAEKLIARELGVGTDALRLGLLSGEKRAAADQIAARWSQMAVALKATSGRCTVTDAVAWVRSRHRRAGGRLRLVVLDYLGLLDSTSQRQSEYERLCEATRALKRTALDLQVCVLLLCQLSREGRKAVRGASGALKGAPEPRLEDLRGSGSIEQDADGVVLLWPQGPQAQPTVPIRAIVAKNRSGTTGPVELEFHRSRGQTFTMATAPVDTSRAHHQHPPEDSEDAFLDHQARAAGDAP